MEFKRKSDSQKKIALDVHMDRFKEVMSIVANCAFHLRKLVLSIPVLWGMIYFARMNMEKLPEQVGLALMSNGQFAETVSRTTAVYGPAAVTGVCLILMLCSRRAIYPWLISLFTLVIPPVILLINTFPS